MGCHRLLLSALQVTKSNSGPQRPTFPIPGWAGGHPSGRSCTAELLSAPSHPGERVGQAGGLAHSLPPSQRSLCPMAESDLSAPAVGSILGGNSLVGEKQRPVREKSAQDRRSASEGGLETGRRGSLPFTPSLCLHTHLHNLPFDPSLHINSSTTRES